MHLDRLKKVGCAVFALMTLLAGLNAGSGTVRAQQGYYDGRYHEYSYGRSREYRENGRFGERYADDVFRLATDRGYDTGFDRGTDDAKRHKAPNPNRSSHYRDGDSGYHDEFGDIEAYRRAYRDGFRHGYANAYRKYHDIYYGHESYYRDLYDRDSDCRDCDYRR